MRDRSKLLVVKGSSISEDLFLNIHNYLPQGCFLVFNDTRVIRARLLFPKSTGSRIEIFCLDPLEPSEPETAFHATARSSWKCLVGNSRKWKEGFLEMKEVGQEPWKPGGREVRLYAERGKALDDGTFEIRFRWEPEEMTFAGANTVLCFTKTPYTREVALEKHSSYMLGTAELPSETRTLTDFMGANAGQNS